MPLSASCGVLVRSLALAVVCGGGFLSSAEAQTPTPSDKNATVQASVTPTNVTPTNAEVRAYLEFRKRMSGVVEKAETGDMPGAAEALSGAITAGGNRFELPYLTRVLSDNDKPVDPALVQADAVTKGIPYWTLEALVRIGQVDAAKQAARQQKEPESKYRALCLVAVAQAGRYLNTPYVLPPIVQEKPAQWIAKTDAPGSKPGMVRTLQVTSLDGPLIAPLLDCRSLEKKGVKDDAGASVTLKEAMDALQPTKSIWLYRELSEVQGKMGDKAGALLSVQAAASLAISEWATTSQDKAKRETARQQIELIATDLEALNDKPGAARLRKLLSTNAFQQIGLPLFITINVGALIIALMMRRASRPPARTLSGKASAG